MKCKAKEDCENKAIYSYLGVNTCYDCMYEHINDNLRHEAIEAFIEMEARKLSA